MLEFGDKFSPLYCPIIGEKHNNRKIILILDWWYFKNLTVGLFSFCNVYLLLKILEKRLKKEKNSCTFKRQVEKLINSFGLILVMKKWHHICLSVDNDVIHKINMAVQLKQIRNGTIVLCLMIKILRWCLNLGFQEK